MSNLYVKDIDGNEITIGEEKKKYSPFFLFFKRHGKLLIWIISLILIMLIIGITYSLIKNMKESPLVKYESDGVIVNFKENNFNIINGVPITDNYAHSLFDKIMNENELEVGVVIKLKEVTLYDRTIVFYSDKSALIKYNNGEYLRVYPYNNEYGVTNEGILNSKAKIVPVIANNKKENGVNILELSDGSIEVTKGNVTFFSRDNNIVIDSNYLYTVVSGVALPIKNDNNKVFYSDGTIKEDNYIIVNSNRYYIKEKKEIFNDIIINYYDNNYAEIINGKTSYIVRNSNHIIYDEDNEILEIIKKEENKTDIKDLMNIKEITINNTNNKKMHYIVVLEESNNYKKHDIDKRLDNNLINFNLLINGNKIYDNKLNINLKDREDYEGINFKNNSYLIYEGDIDKLLTTNIKIGMWIDYERITNKYMNSGFVGTIKVYIEEIDD